MNILLPIDFTSRTEITMRSALNIAKKINVKVSLLHIIDEPGPSELEPSADLMAKSEKESEHNAFMTELIKKRKIQMDSFVSQFKDDKIEITTDFEIGAFQDALENYLQKNKVDLVLMGSSGEISAMEWMKGNHAARVLRVSSVPLLVVKEDHLVKTLDNLLLLVELKNYDKQPVKLIKEFADVLDMKVHIGHVKRSKDIVEEDIHGRLKEFANSNDFSNFSIHVIGKGEKVERITNFSDHQQFDIISAISEGESGLMRLFFGSDTEKFINDLKQPVLAISE